MLQSKYGKKYTKNTAMDHIPVMTRIYLNPCGYLNYLYPKLHYSRTKGNDIGR